MSRGWAERHTEEGAPLEKKSVPAVGLVAAILRIVWPSASPVRAENERNVMQVGLCRNDALKLLDPACVNKAQTHTAWYGHFFHALISWTREWIGLQRVMAFWRVGRVAAFADPSVPSKFDG